MPRSPSRQRSGTDKTLRGYRDKRDFARTPEPAAGAAPAPGGRRFVVHMHDASRLHYDLRLEIDGVLKSWAVTRGPSLDPKVRRLAVHVEDHPLSYVDFEDVIPAGQYGAGPMIVWDRGHWVPMGDVGRQYAAGQIKFRLDGEKLGGGWTLVRLKGRDEDGRNWLLIKERDVFARGEADGVVTEALPRSVVSGLTVGELARARAPRPVRRGRRPPGKVAPGRLTGARKAALAPAPRLMLATAVDEAPTGADWLHEIKLDGYRTICRLEDGTARLFTRNGHDWTHRYPFIADAFSGLACRDALIDGEVCAVDGEGRTSFADLQAALGEGRSEPLLFYAFDLIHLDGHDLAAVPLAKRKDALAALLAPLVHDRSAVQISDHVRGNGAAFFDHASGMGLEGVVSKRAGSAYAPGRSRDWVKTKCVQAGEFLVIGYEESVAAGGLSALLLAEDEGGLAYVGKVGTGFTAEGAARLRATLAAAARTSPLFAFTTREKLGAVTWTEPRHLADVRHRGRTRDGRLRAAAFRGLREDQTLAAAAAGPEPEPVSDADLAAIWVTNPDRVMFGEGGPTKLDLVLYYARVGNRMLPELVDRPLTLVRCPSGRLDDTFYQRHANEGMAAHVRGIDIPSGRDEERDDYLYIGDAKGLFSLAQFGVVEFHPWGCRVDRPERPDRLVLDLDPDEGLEWRDVVAAAHHIRAELAEIGLTAFVRTTGGKGLHLVVPVERRTSWADFRRFAQAFVEALARDEPGRYTASISKSARRGRIFVDHVRNVRGATAVASYSLRARRGAPVATPLAWPELATLDDPRELDYRTVPERIAGMAADPWRGLADASRRITREMSRGLGIRG